MQARSANLLALLKGPKQFVIPIYQRTYSWHLSQCEQLLKDILRVGQSGTHGHFIGSVVYFQESIHTVSDVPCLLMIDGQQRLTTITLLIAALSEFVAANEVRIDTNSTKLKNYYLFNAEEEHELHYKLVLTRRDKQNLIEILDGIKLSEPASLRLVENYQFFKSKINSENVEAIYNGLLRLFVVDVALEKDIDNPQLIFESMNSTGLDLSQADLIRNYVLMGQKVKLQTELYEKYWHPMEQGYGNEYSQYFDSFMRDYLSVKTGIISNIGRVYEAFKQYAGNKLSSENSNITELVQDIYKYSGYYVNMVLHKESRAILLKVFKRISRLKVDVSYPFLLAVYADYANSVLSEGDFEKILCLVENYVFRRAICGIPTNSLNKTFVTLYQSVRYETYLESVQAAFQLLGSYKRFPSDNEFCNELIAKDVYNFRNRNYLLDRLENYQRKEPVSVDEYTIEHVMPQNEKLNQAWQKMLGENWKEVHETYLHTLGNITLTGYNSELSDHSFANKKAIEGGFDDSPLRLNAYLRKTEQWNEKEIVSRAKELADKAKEVWFAPSLEESVLDKYRRKQEKCEQYTLEHYEFTNEMMQLYYALRQRILNIDSSVSVEFKKQYIAFKSATNFVDIIPQKSRLLLMLNTAYPEIIDPKGLCRDVTDIGRWGNGDVELGFARMEDIEDVMDLIRQTFEMQME